LNKWETHCIKKEHNTKRQPSPKAGQRRESEQERKVTSQAGKERSQRKANKDYIVMEGQTLAT